MPIVKAKTPLLACPAQSHTDYREPAMFSQPVKLGVTFRFRLAARLEDGLSATCQRALIRLFRRQPTSEVAEAQTARCTKSLLGSSS